MIKHFSKLGLAAVIGLVAAGTAFASPIASVQTTGMSSPQSVTLSPNGPNTYVGYAALGGWTVSITVQSYAPNATPNGGFDLNTFTAACTLSSGCANLTVMSSDTGFTSSTGANGFESALGNNQHGVGSVQQCAWDGSNAIGCFSLSGSGVGSTVGGGPEVGGPSNPYSLTIADTFTTSCTTSTGHCVSFSTDASIVTAPEPGALAIFGAGLLGCALFINRRRRASQRS